MMNLRSEGNFEACIGRHPRPCRGERADTTTFDKLQVAFNGGSGNLSCSEVANCSRLLLTFTPSRIILCADRSTWTSHGSTYGRMPMGPHQFPLLISEQFQQE